MADPLNETVRDEQFRIPTRAEHGRRVRRIWTACILFALSILVGMGGTVSLLFIQDKNVHVIVAVSTICFQVVISMFATGFTTPLFLEQRLNFILGLEMSRRGLEIGEKTAGTLDKVDGSIEKRGERFDKLMGRLESMMEQAEKGEGALANRFETMFRDEMKLLRAEIREERGRVDDEIGAALEEGEASVEETGEAAGEFPGPAAGDGETCPFCGQVHEGPCLTPTDGARCSGCGGGHDILECPTRSKAQ